MEFYEIHRPWCVRKLVGKDWGGVLQKWSSPKCNNLGENRFVHNLVLK